MSIWGKLIGGAAGFALGGPFGAFVGGAAGHVVDMLHGEEGRPDQVPTKGTAFTIAVIVLGAKMAKVDGRVTPEEITAFRQAFHVDEGDVGRVAMVFDRAKRDAQGFEFYARQLREILEGERDMLERVLDGLFHIAKADAMVNQAELDYLAAVAALFGLSAADFVRITHHHLGPGRKTAERHDPYHVLGLEPGAAPDLVKRAYRRLVREHHPDRLIAKGMPEETVRRATERLAAINGAYAQITAERGG